MIFFSQFIINSDVFLYVRLLGAKGIRGEIWENKSQKSICNLYLILAEALIADVIVKISV